MIKKSLFVMQEGEPITPEEEDSTPSEESSEEPPAEE